MLVAIGSLTAMGVTLGTILGAAAKFLAVEENPLEEELKALLPGSQCGQCGFPGCSAAATAIVDGRAAVTICPPGGKALAAALSAKLGISLDLSDVVDEGPKLAQVAEEICIGC